MASKLDEEILSSDSDVESREVESDQIESEEEETVQEKKLRLAKHLIDQIEKQKQSELNDRDESSYVNNRLVEELHGKIGKLRKEIANNYLAGKIQRQLKGHRLAVTCLAVSPNLDYLFSGSKDGTIIKWNFQTGMKMNTIKKILPNSENNNSKGHRGEIFCMALSDDCKYLATSGRDKSIKLWNPDNCEFIYSFEGHRDAVSGLVFRLNSHDLYSCSFDRSVKIWNADQLVYVETLFGHQDKVLAIDSLSKERCITCGARDRSLRLWKIPEESQLVFNAAHYDSIDCACLVNEETFFSGSNDGTLGIWSIAKKKPIFSIKNAHKNHITNGYNSCGWITSVAAYHNSDLLASGSDDGSIRIWSYTNLKNTLVERFQIKIDGYINDLKFSNDGTHLIAAVGQEHKLGRWSSIKNAKNSIIIIKFDISNENINKSN